MEGQQESRAVLITGGTSGIGLAAAQRFAAAGDCVLIAGRDAARGAAAKKTLAGLIPELAALIETAEDALR